MTEDRFRQYIDRHVQEGKPFIAYWHPTGYGLLKTGPVEIRLPERPKPTLKTVSAAARKKFYDNLLKLRRRSFAPKILYIEYDGSQVVEQEV